MDQRVAMLDRMIVNTSYDRGPKILRMVKEGAPRLHHAWLSGAYKGFSECVARKDVECREEHGVSAREHYDLDREHMV